MVPIVRDERAVDAPDVTMPIETIGVLEQHARRSSVGSRSIAPVIGLIALVLGIFARPERRDVLRGLGEFGISLAASMSCSATSSPCSS